MEKIANGKLYVVCNATEQSITGNEKEAVKKYCDLWKTGQKTTDVFEISLPSKTIKDWNVTKIPTEKLLAAVMDHFATGDGGKDGTV